MISPGSTCFIIHAVAFMDTDVPQGDCGLFFSLPAWMILLAMSAALSFYSVGYFGPRGRVVFVHPTPAPDPPAWSNVMTNKRQYLKKQAWPLRHSDLTEWVNKQ